MKSLSPQLFFVQIDLSSFENRLRRYIGLRRYSDGEHWTNTPKSKIIM